MCKIHMRVTGSIYVREDMCTYPHVVCPSNLWWQSPQPPQGARGTVAHRIYQQPFRKRTVACRIATKLAKRALSYIYISCRRRKFTSYQCAWAKLSWPAAHTRTDVRACLLACNQSRTIIFILSLPPALIIHDSIISHHDRETIHTYWIFTPFCVFLFAGVYYAFVLLCFVDHPAVNLINNYLIFNVYTISTWCF